MNDIINIISTCGFPICAFLLAWYSLKYCFDRITALTEAVNENTKTLSLLVEEVKDLTTKED